MLVMGAVDAPLWSFFSLFGVVKERGEPRPPRAKSPAKPRPPGGSGGSKSPKKGDRPRGSKKVYLEDLYHVGRAFTVVAGGQGVHMASKSCSLFREFLRGEGENKMSSWPSV